MNTKPAVLTKTNTKMLAVQASTHGKARELAAALGVPLYLAVDMAIETALGANKAMRPPSKGNGDANN
jgi:NAD-dependent oxidoreductase involved in siderophore biosynthesis